MFDYVLKGGTVVDGSRGKPFERSRNEFHCKGADERRIIRFLPKFCGKIFKSRKVTFGSLNRNANRRKLPPKGCGKRFHLFAAGEFQPHHHADAVDRLSCVQIHTAADHRSGKADRSRQDV